MWFIWFLLRIDDPHEALRRFFVVSRTAFIATLVLAGVTSIFCCLAIIAARGPQCAQSGYDLMEGYRAGDFVGLVVWSACMTLMVRALGWPPLRNKKMLVRAFAQETQVEQGPAFFHMSGGALSVYGGLFFLCVLSVVPPWIAAEHGLTILKHCPLPIGLP
jgi:hypothetical protein